MLGLSTTEVFAHLCSILLIVLVLNRLYTTTCILKPEPKTHCSSADLQSCQLSLKRHLVLRHGGERQEVISSRDVYERRRQCNLLGVSASQARRRSLFISDFLLVSLHLSGHLSYLRVLSHTLILLGLNWTLVCFSTAITLECGTKQPIGGFLSLGLLPSHLQHSSKAI